MVGKMMELFDGWCAVCVDKDYDKMIKLFAKDAKFWIPGMLPKPLTGNTLKAFVESAVSKMEGYRVKKLFVCETENSIVVEWIVDYKDITLRKAFESRGVTIIEANEEGLIQSMREYVRSQG